MSVSLNCQIMKCGAEAEAELIDRCRQGDSKAWDELFDRHYAATARFVFQLSLDFTQQDIEEICQETFLAVVKKLDSFGGKSQFQTWLFRIAANKARDYRQHQHADKRGGGQATVPLHTNDNETGMAVDPPSQQPWPDSVLVESERMATLGHALEQLDTACREVIDLRYFGDLSYEEIGAELKLNPKTVSSRLSRCLDKLEEIVRAAFSREKSSPFSV